MVASMFGGIVVNHVGSMHSSSSYWPITGVLVCGAIGYTTRSPLVRSDGNLNSGRYISGVLNPWLYFLFESYETLRFSRIMYCRMFLVLYGPSMIRKMFGCFSLACAFFRSLTNSKRFIQGCRTPGSSTYLSDYD
ncbi:hypothetical protein TNCV_2985281 [Trichonephila clavipes]|nr:hypothetical protein TNCV_2985281 [Trichonephila clavipes]